MAYEIAQQDVAWVTEHLDYREKGGYAPVTVTFHPHDQSEDPFELKIYVGSADNPFFLGPAPLDDVAKQISTAVGPSGPNTEYLFQLATALRELIPNTYDEHLFELEKRVKEICHEGQSEQDSGDRNR